ncbi:hypothetical protein WJR50_14600 [Catalinimonas sp. 4WD22]|uniref:hypothetical protein n=1 Tax=Catalinimonas locisalis TaxID=3133978 RepID=UPI003101ABC8
MKNIFLPIICLSLIFTSGCNNDNYDPLGDLIVNLVRSSSVPPNPVFNELNIGIFPSETLLTNEFTPDSAFKQATIDLDVDEGETPTAVITNILPGTYVLALIGFPSSENVPKQVIQITADDVTVVDFNL